MVAERVGGHPLGGSTKERQRGLSMARYRHGLRGTVRSSSAWRRASSLGMLVKNTSCASTTSYRVWEGAGLQTAVSGVSALRKEHHSEGQMGRTRPVNGCPPANGKDGARPGSPNPTLTLTAPEPRGPPKGWERPEIKPRREAGSRNDPPPAALAPGCDASVALGLLHCAGGGSASSMAMPVHPQSPRELQGRARGGSLGSGLGESLALRPAALLAVPGSAKLHISYCCLLFQTTRSPL